MGDKCYGNKTPPQKKTTNGPWNPRQGGLAILNRLFRGGRLEVVFVQMLGVVKELFLPASEGRTFQAEATTIAKSQSWEATCGV